MRAAVVAAVVIASGLVPATGRAAEDGNTVHGHVAMPTGPTPGRCSPPVLGDQGETAWVVDRVAPGWLFMLTAVAEYPNDIDIAFFRSRADCDAGTNPLPHANRAGREEGVVPAGAGVAVVTLQSGRDAAFTYRELQPLSQVGPSKRGAPTVVAIVEPNGFSPYHYDFVGHQHPWNTDADKKNDIDFSQDPRQYVPGYPGAEPLAITVPTSPDQDVSGLAAGPDATAWSSMQPSKPGDVHLYRFPGTKIIGAVKTGGFVMTNDVHGTRTSSVAVGNIHGTCPECLVVLVSGTAALEWVAAQPWIDVVNNSYKAQVAGVGLGDADEITKPAVEAGQTVVWSSGNGWAGTMGDVPELTYTSSQTGPDWVVTVGGNYVGEGDENYRGTGKPVDVVAPSNGYKSAAGRTANGEDYFSGTSNAGPVVAGTLARIIQWGRNELRAEVGGHSSGVVARGKRVRCGDANPHCPLGDGILTRAEVQEVLFRHVLPTQQPRVRTGTGGAVAPALTVPSTEQHPYVTQGHGLVFGRTPGRYEVEHRRLFDALRGDIEPFARPAGERNWMMVDSRCRQRLFGTWSGGYHSGADPVLDPTADAPSVALNDMCTRLRERALGGNTPRDVAVDWGIPLPPPMF